MSDHHASSVPKGPPGIILFTPRIACGLLGILIAAMVAGLNNRVAGLVLVDMQGALGFASDDASWLNTVYSAGELAAMPFATWCAITFSMRRFHSLMLSTALCLAAIIPFIHNLNLLLTVRALQGLCSGALIPILMMAALRFLPPHIRLHGLALYALTATFSPNVALAIATWSVDHVEDWRWAYWHVIPLGLMALGLVNYGIPKMPLVLPRLKQGNWLGMCLGIPGLAFLVIAFDQGVRLDWFHSPIIQSSLLAGIVFTCLFLITEWRHPTPFMKLQLLQRRNLGLGFSVFFILLIVMSSAVVLPSNTLMHLHNFRLQQIAAIGLVVGLPQLVLGSIVALLLYQKWVDARYLFALGLMCIALACWMASFITSDWRIAEFMPAEILQMIGQPLAVVSMLFLGTSVVQPMEGPYVAGIINTLRAFGTVFGASVVGQFLSQRSKIYHEQLLDQAALHTHQSTPFNINLAQLAADISQQATILATADLYRFFAIIAVVLIPIVLCLQYIPAPQLQTAPKAPQPNDSK
ncbi:MFS transporter [Acinetobacter populi]|uniref:MFS transporter n=1 Tax=Acinetobacter populi TaxID=1582270 RepID=A0A1Z9YXD9_9GAMM|nr:MFS transporter [Acinetobacter populi]OUY06867.1 MFS transporter [Acinetobacter populi]